jgi:hypothetical protein
MANDLYDTLLRRLVQLRNGDVNYKTAKDDLWKLVATDPDTYLEMFFHNWFNHNWTRDQNAKAFPASAPARPYTRRKETLSEMRERRKQDANLRGVQLLNGFLPDGETRLKDATGAQIRTVGGWFSLIAKHVKPNEVVGRKLTAEQITNLWTQAE